MIGVCEFLSTSLYGAAVGDGGSQLNVVPLPKLEATDVGYLKGIGAVEPAVSEAKYPELRFNAISVG